MSTRLGGWTEQAQCAEMPLGLFFDPGLADAAKAVCADCPVIGKCLQEALDDPVEGDHGVRGGTTRSQRLRLRKLAALGGERRPVCEDETCVREPVHRGLCAAHYSKAVKLANPCVADGCARQRFKHQLCKKHMKERGL